MQNKSILWIFVILLALVTVYMLSFGFVAKGFEQKMLKQASDSLQVDIAAASSDSSCMALQKKYLVDSSEAKVYPLMGTAYSELKRKQLNLGLDLKGGMSVTLEVSIPELLVAISDNSTNAVFRTSIDEARLAMNSSTSSYIDLFFESWKKNNTQQFKLWRIFNNIETQDKFPANMSDEDVIKTLRAEAQAAVDNTENIIKKRIDQLGVAQANVQKLSLGGRILVELPGVEDRERAIKMLKATANLEFWNTYITDEVFFKMSELNIVLGKKMAPEFYSKDPNRPQKDSLMRVAMSDTSLTKIERDSIQLAFSDTTVKADSLLTDAELNRKYPFRQLQLNPQRGSAVIGYARSGDVANLDKMLKSPEALAALPEDLKLMWDAKSTKNITTLYGIKDDNLGQLGKAKLTGKSIVDARQDFDQITGEVNVTMTMDGEGGAVWREMTRKNAADNKRPIAIVMDGMVYSAPSVTTEIPNGSSVITFGGEGSRESRVLEAQDLAGLLKAGSLPAPARIINLEVVGPTLGQENIKAGVWSFFGAFIAVLIYMLIYYAFGGFAAAIALIANLFFLIGALVSIGASLTLPGIAGIVLTMGMAVDANVLIFERIKEELRSGKAMSAALKEGYSKAYSAIFDGNITTLLTGVVLYATGSGPIRGFAVTLIIGIFTTLFTAIIISRLIVYWKFEKSKTVSFYTNSTKNLFTNVNFDFIGKRRRFYIVSLVLIVIGVASIFTRGFNNGIDFVGGTSYTVNFDSKIDANDLRKNLNATLIENGQTSSNTVQEVAGSGNRFKITTNFMVTSNADDVEKQIETKVKEALSKSGNCSIDQTFKVDASMSDDFRKQAFWATILSVLVIGLYILFRFQKWDFALGAIVALFHDILITMGVYSLLNGIVPFTLELNQVFIGALLTIAGYSINDTVIIFDRLREYLKVRKAGSSIEPTINDALNSTLGRTFNTSMTTLVTLIIMFIFGSDDIKGFCFALIVGIVAGTYSSVFIATPLVVDIRKMVGKSSSTDAESAAAKAAAIKA
jgi:SecD/SecF fusion protein